MNHPEVTEQALSILRSGDPFQWYVITLLALVMYCYDWQPKTQARFIGAVFALDALLLAVFAGGPGWI